MNRKCFYCFNNVNLNDKDDELLKDWIEFRFEKLETNLTDKDKEHALNYDTFCEKILDVISDKDSDYVSDILDDFREELLNYSIYWNEKYYKTGFSDCLNLVIMSLGGNNIASK